MKNCCHGVTRSAGWLLVLVASLLYRIPVAAQSSNGVLREVFTGIGGNAVSDLTSHPSYPCCPSLETIQPTFEAPAEFAETYGQRMRALVVAPLTGNYTFWIASDDQGALFLSTTENPAQRTQIANVTSWTSSREWTKEANQQSATNIALVAGQRYYIEALQKEGGGGDNLAVRWRLPNGTIEEPIPNSRLIVVGLGPPVITTQPTSQTVVEGGPASFTVQLQRMLGATFQWKRNGTNVPGATNATLTLPLVTLADTASSFFCSITNSLGGTNTTSAILTVVPDTTRPTLGTVGNLGEPQIVFVVFSEPVEEASATDAGNYTINGGIAVTRAAFGVDARTVILTTSTMAQNLTYTLAVSNVRDRATNPNTILPNSQRTFSVVTRPLDISYLSLPRESAGPSSRRHGVVISEVMYHPTNRVDGRNLEFIELYNAQPWFEEVGGWRISGAVDYRFPSNAIIPARSYIVVAASKTDFQAVYGGINPTNIFGPFSNSNFLQNSSGTLRLRNERDAVICEMNYSGDPPYSAAADGAGHSLVLARPSYGERDPRAWSQSDSAGGSPGREDTVTGNTYRTIVINEFLAHTDPPFEDYIELYNYGTSSINLQNCILSDDAGTNKFLIPTNTIIAPRGFAAFTETQLGFALSSGGETIFLKHPSAQRVIDSIRFDAQENGVATGRSPDGAPALTRLSTPTPGTNNAPFKIADVVINEIMYDPISGDADDEYVELFNRGTNTVSLGGWRLRDAVSFDIPPGTSILPGGYLVIARHAGHLRTNYTGLTAVNTLGDYDGSLANAGERLELNMPDDTVTTNAIGQLKTNVIHIMVDEVTYGPGGRWGPFAHGGGSSLELRDPRADRRLAPNWADSDESSKSPWVTVQATGTMDHGYADAHQLHVTLLGAGEALIDNVEVIPAGGTNVIGNGTFESGTPGWVFQGNHNQTSWEPTEGFASSRSLHLRATGRGDTGANRVRTQLPFTLAQGTIVTLRARVRWLKGNPNLLLRLRGNWMEAGGYILDARNLGTPGGPNSRATANAGPAIVDVRHWPPLPAASQPVLVTARVHDPDGLAYLVVNYRIDPTTNYLTLAMTNNGAGLYSTVMPGQAGGTGAAFFVQASDASYPSASSAFPDDAPVRECIVRWGDTTIPGTLPTYRFWISATNVARWSREEKMSNNPKDVTFIHGTNRVIYNAGAWFHGSPYHSPGYDSPLGVSCDYDLGFPEDERLLGETDINLFRPGNGGGDGTAQNEIHGNWFGRQFGVPYLYHRPVFVFVNGQRRETVFHDAQQPNGDFVEQWFPDDPDGDLHKIQLGFEFGDTASGASEAGYAAVGANLANYVTTGGVKKQARYRQTWPRRAASPQELNDYTNIFTLVGTVLTNASIGSYAYTAALTNAVDVEEWFKVHVTQHLFNNPDSFSYGGGQNAFAYKPERDTWKLFLWDIDFAFGGSPTDANLTGIGGADHGPRNDHPPFARIYWQALIQAANGMLLSTRSDPILDARYNGMVAGGASAGSPAGIKSFIASRRSFILSQITANQSSFAITASGGADFSTNRNVAILTGTAPLDVRAIVVNGVAYPTTWTTFNTWQIAVPLVTGTNTLQITAIDPRGAPVAGVSRSIRINYTGATESPVGRVVINEIMYNPIVPGGSFVELFNASTTNAFDLSRWRLEGTDFAFLDGTVLDPGGFAVLTKDRSAYALAYGSLTPVIGTFEGTLRNEGETLRLIKPGPTPEQDEIVDQLTYEPLPPWPAAANGLGPSLQLIDAFQDNQRAANWAVAFSGITNAPQTLLTITNVWRFETNSDLSSVNWTAPGFNDSAWQTGRSLLYNETAPLPAPTGTLLGLGRITYYFRTRFNYTGPLGAAALRMQIVLDDGAVLYLNGQELYRVRMPAGPVNYSTLANAGVGDATYEGPFVLPASALVQGDNFLAAEVHQSGAASSDVVFGMTLETTYDTVSRHTPGLPNSVRATLPAFPPVWLNEFSPNNSLIASNNMPDRLGDRDPWVELYNGGTNAISLNGWFLSDNFTNLTRWPFPADAVVGPKQFLVVWLDGEPGESAPNELHASFRAAPNAGSVALARGAPNPTLIDHLNYDLPTPGRSYGGFPDGNATARRAFSIVTPGTNNNSASAPITVFINEWMADNAFFMTDPADGDNEDWIELYNPGADPVDLDGCFLTDDLLEKLKWPFPAGTRIPGRGYLLVWADGETGQNNPEEPDLHANFSLARTGEAIGLFAADGTLIDALIFNLQAPDISQGRIPDGSATILALSTPTPRASNLSVLTNDPPVLDPIGNRTVNEGSELMFTATASDPNTPGQELNYSFVGPAPAGATLNPASGIFLWTPTEPQGPRHYPVTIRVTDSGFPPLTDEETFTIAVNEVNSPPQLGFQTEWTIFGEHAFQFSAAGSDPDLPMQTLEYALDPDAPTEATLDPLTGNFSWTPSAAQTPGAYSITFHATDNGVPRLSATRTIEVNVRSSLVATILRVGEQVSISFTTIPGHSYRVLYKNNLAESWKPLGQVMPAEDTSLAVQDTLGERDQRFYQIERVD